MNVCAGLGECLRACVLESGKAGLPFLTPSPPRCMVIGNLLNLAEPVSFCVQLGWYPWYGVGIRVKQMGYVRVLRMSLSQGTCQYTSLVNTYYVPSSVLGALLKAVISGGSWEKWCLVCNRRSVNI